MIKKSDWQAVFSEPPAEDELLAYARGELSAEESARMKERLALHPDLEAAYSLPFPTEDPRPGDPDFLGEAELSKRWNAFRKRVHDRDRVVPFPRIVYAMAAGVILFVALGWWQSHRTVQRLSRQISSPLVIPEEHILSPDDRQRGPRVSTTITAGSDLLLEPMLVDRREFPDYRAELRDLTGGPPRAIWSATGLQRSGDNTFSIFIPAAFLRPGRYQLVVSGIDGTVARELATYTIVVTPPAMQ